MNDRPPATVAWVSPGYWPGPAVSARPAMRWNHCHNRRHHGGRGDTRTKGGGSRGGVKTFAITGTYA